MVLVVRSFEYLKFGLRKEWKRLVLFLMLLSLESFGLFDFWLALA